MKKQFRYLVLISFLENQGYMNLSEAIEKLRQGVYRKNRNTRMKQLESFIESVRGIAGEEVYESHFSRSEIDELQGKVKFSYKDLQIWCMAKLPKFTIKMEIVRDCEDGGKKTSMVCCKIKIYKEDEEDSLSTTMAWF